MKPVDNITPAAKALMIKKISFSGLNAGITLPRSGIQTPIALATSIDANAAILYLRALDLSLSSSSSSHVHSASAKVGSIIKRMKMVKISRCQFGDLLIPISMTKTEEKIWERQSRGTSEVINTKP